MSNVETGSLQIGRRELFDRAWSKPMAANASEIGTTATALTALAQRLGLPLPRAGHWMKKDFGKEPSTPKFPADAGLDEKVYPLPRPRLRIPRTAPTKVKGSPQPELGESLKPGGLPV